MKDESVVVFGAGRFGSALAKELFQQGIEVMVIDNDTEIVQDLSAELPNVVKADILDEATIEELGLKNFDVAVIAIGKNLEASIVATVVAKEHGIPLIYGKATTEMQSKILKKVGADYVVYPEMEMGKKMGRVIAKKSIMEYIHFSDEYSIFEIVPPKKWINKTIAEIDVRNRYTINIIAIRKDDDETIIVPHSSTVIGKSDKIVVIGRDEVVNELEQNG